MSYQQSLWFPANHDKSSPAPAQSETFTSYVKYWANERLLDRDSSRAKLSSSTNYHKSRHIKDKYLRKFYPNRFRPKHSVLICISILFALLILCYFAIERKRRATIESNEKFARIQHQVSQMIISRPGLTIDKPHFCSGNTSAYDLMTFPGWKEIESDTTNRQLMVKIRSRLFSNETLVCIRIRSKLTKIK